jgi:hypothetical protein
MSGPLASWVGEHSKASWRGKVVLKEYALAAYDDGTPATDVSRDDLARRTGCSTTTVKTGRQEVLELGELVELQAPVGRGNVGSYQVSVTLCPAEAHCWTCALLSQLLEKGRPAAPSGARKGSRIGGKGSRIRGKGSRGDPTNVTETYPPSGGTSPSGESSDARSARSPQGARSARSSEQGPAKIGPPSDRAALWASIGRAPPAGDRDDPVALEARRQEQLAALKASAARDEQAAAS